MRKTLALSLGLFVLMVFVGCTKLSSMQKKCESLNANAQLNLRYMHEHPLTSEIGAIYYEDASSYSAQNDACYESRIREAQGIKWFEINKVIFSADTGGGTEQSLFSGKCVTSEYFLVNNFYPDALKQSEESDLCTYTETGISIQYHNKINELISK